MSSINYEEEKRKIRERYDRVHTGLDDHENDFEEVNTVSRKFLHFEHENELSERSKSFRLRSYQKAKSKEKCATIASTLKRFLIIFIIISVICGAVFFVSKLLAKTRLKTFTLEGNGTHFEKFTGLNGFPPEELGTLELSNVQLIATDLLTTLKESPRIRSIKLQNVKIIGEFNETVNLPLLQEFVYAETIEQKNIVDIMTTMTESKFKSILFFRDTNSPYEVGPRASRHRSRRQGDPVPLSDLDLTKIWEMNVNFNITVEGYTMILVNHTRGELILPWLSYLKREEIIQNAGKDLKRLSCNRLKLSIDALPPKITHLVLRDVTLIGGDFTSLLRKLNKLVDIRVSFGRSTLLDVIDLPRKTLRNLALSKASLFSSNITSLSSGTKRLKLDSLTLLNPSLTWSSVEELHNIFQVNELAISEYTINSTSAERLSGANGKEEPNELLLKNVLNTEAERVFMYKFRGVTNGGEMAKWLNATGISRETSSFVLDKISSQWKSRSLDWNEWHFYKHHAMGFDKFWSHS